MINEKALARAHTPPAWWYRCGERLALEKHHILSGQWQVLAHRDEVSGPGDYTSGCAGGEPWIVVRDVSGALRGFANVCRHNGTPVADGAGTLEKFVCPYHGWEYQLSGELKSAPRIGGIEEFQREDYALSAFPVMEVGPLVFGNISGDASPLQFNELEQRLEVSDWNQLIRRERRSYHLQCNWKVFVDNYLDGGYHVPFLHPNLSSNLDLKEYKTELFHTYSIQSVSPSSTADKRLGADAIYGWVFPNLMINRYGPMMDINVVFPTGPESCRVDFDWYFEENASEEFVASALLDSEKVQDEDIDVCERLQRGMASMHFKPGPYAPRVEHGKFHFHTLINSHLPDQKSGD